MNDPLISVIIPVFNEENRIARAITSMQNQTYKNLEIIVVDDGSTDKTPETVKQIAKTDSRVNFYQPTDLDKKKKNWRGYDINAGYAARNYGFLKAKGEWITTQDADDSSMINRIETQYKLAKKYNATLVTVTWQQLTDTANGKSLDVDRIFKDIGEDAIITRPDEIYESARKNRGLLMIEPIHKFIPFTIKWFPYTRKLFYRSTNTYPGADNCMLFSKKVIESGILFRKRNERTWGVPSGRGSGRDFAFRVAYKFKNSFSFKLPLYLWDVKSQNKAFEDYGKYIK